MASAQASDGPGMSLEIRKEAPTSLAVAGDETSCQGPSWLQLGFEMPTEEEALRALSVEISTHTPPLNNICFTNVYVASYLGGAIWDRAVHVESLSRMGEIGMEEASNSVGALLARVSLRLVSFSNFYFLFFQ